MKIKTNSTVLVAPLDWGLGHATRCIPLINHLLNLGCNVILAAERSQEKLLKQEFPSLEFVHLPGYRIKYIRNKYFFPFAILFQLPKIYSAIRNERKWLNKFITQHPVDAVISDNRYGLSTIKIPCVFITHQLTVKAPFALAERIIRNFNYHLIRKFSACWVPDQEGKPNIAGKLSHPKFFPPIPVTYIGGLSRFERKLVPTKYDLLIVLSGPEPQRTVLEKTMLSEIRMFRGKVLLVRGLPGEVDIPDFAKDVTVKNHLSATELEMAFNASDYIISRTGYTTVMDICKLKKKAILIPTPGQTEQEYLGDQLHKQSWCLTISQEGFKLSDAVEQARVFPFMIPDFDMDQYKKVVEQWVNALPNR